MIILLKGNFMNNFKPSKDFCQQLDDLLVQNLGKNFTITRDAHGAYLFQLGNGQVVYTKYDEKEKANKISSRG